MDIEDQKINIEVNFPRGEDFYTSIFSLDTEKENATLQFYKEDTEFNSFERFLKISDNLKINQLLVTKFEEVV